MTVRANDGSYAIQVASFTSRNRADRLVSELSKAGYQARAVEFNLGPPRGLVLQIRIDGYESAEGAARDLARIRESPRLRRRTPAATLTLQNPSSNTARPERDTEHTFAR